MPVSPTYPGVYIEELPSGVRPVIGVATSITAFVGYAPLGPENRAVRLANFGDFERRFGGIDRESEMSFAVQQFFRNGGSDALVVRVPEGRRRGPPSITLLDEHRAPAPKVGAGAASASSTGAWGNELARRRRPRRGTPPTPRRSTSRVARPRQPAKVERFTDLSVRPGSPRSPWPQLNDLDSGSEPRRGLGRANNAGGRPCRAARRRDHHVAARPSTPRRTTG